MLQYRIVIKLAKPTHGNIEQLNVQLPIRKHC